MTVPAPSDRLPWRLSELVGTRQETPSAKTLIFSVPGWPGHRPGQHLDVRLTADDGYEAQRSYSIASPPEDGERLSLLVEQLNDGEVSPYLTEELRPGDRIELRGPIGGHFVWHSTEPGPLILVAGGSGIAPLMAMLRHRAAAPVRPVFPATLLASWRTVDAIIFRDELDRLAATDPSLRVVHTLTRAQPPGWTGYARRIDRAMLAEVVGSPTPDSLAFVCGPTSLVEAAATDLVDLGFPPDRVRTERFGPSGS